jgi:pyrroline-5-carboxylate reductase
MIRVAFLGAGRMASAMVAGLLESKAYTPEELACWTPSGQSAAALAGQSGIQRLESAAALMDQADVLVVACKPQHLASLDPSWAELTRGRLVVSTLAGKRLARLSSSFPAARNIVRTMPNTPGRIRAGITPYCTLHSPSPLDQTTIETLLGALGEWLAVPEEKMDAVTAISGSGPAYFFEFVAGLQAAGTRLGLSTTEANRLAVVTALGASRLMMETDRSPEHLRDEVTSPKGTTFAALQQFAASDLRAIIAKATAAAAARSAELSAD